MSWVENHHNFEGENWSDILEEMHGAGPTAYANVQALFWSPSVSSLFELGPCDAK